MEEVERIAELMSQSPEVSATSASLLPVATAKLLPAVRTRCLPPRLHRGGACRQIAYGI
jgi:hypothetical protein